MYVCKELMERQETAPRNALVGLLFYKDGTCIPGIMIDLSQDIATEERIKDLYRKKKLTHFSLHFEPEGAVSVDVSKELLDGTRLEELAIRFFPEKVEDIDAFMGMMELVHSWTLIIRLLKSEMHFMVNPDNDEVMYRYVSRHISNLKKFKSEIA